MSLTELPLLLPGRVFASPMPFSIYDPEGECLGDFKRKRVSVVVILAEEEEYLLRARRDLKSLYRDEGFEIIHVPTPDFGVPPKEELLGAVKRVTELARAGRNIAIHCHAGVGRTGLFAAFLARQVLGLSGEEAIRWTRRYIPGAVEAEVQRSMVLEDRDNGQGGQACKHALG
jgi:protein-tyrosine phosphatase